MIPSRWINQHLVGSEQAILPNQFFFSTFFRDATIYQAEPLTKNQFDKKKSMERDMVKRLSVALGVPQKLSQQFCGTIGTYWCRNVNIFGRTLFRCKKIYISHKYIYIYGLYVKKVDRKRWDERFDILRGGRIRYFIHSGLPVDLHNGGLYF